MKNSASLERTETQEAALAAARAQVESLAAALDKTRARVALRQQEFTASWPPCRGAKPFARLIEPELLTRFDRLSALPRHRHCPR